MRFLDSFKQLFSIPNVWAHVLYPRSEDVAKAVLSHELKWNNSVAFFQISLRIIFFVLPKLSQVKERVNLLFCFFVKFVELTVRDFFFRQEIFHPCWIPLDKYMNSCPKVFWNVFGIIIFPFFLNSQFPP